MRRAWAKREENVLKALKPCLSQTRLRSPPCLIWSPLGTSCFEEQYFHPSKFCKQVFSLLSTHIECTKKMLLHCPKLLQTHSFPTSDQLTAPVHCPLISPDPGSGPLGLPCAPVPSSLFTAWQLEIFFPVNLIFCPASPCSPQCLPSALAINTKAFGQALGILCDLSGLPAFWAPAPQDPSSRPPSSPHGSFWLIHELMFRLILAAIPPAQWSPCSFLPPKPSGLL